MPNIIFLMGVSSSGKSTLANELQRRANEEYLIVGFDQAVESLDKKYWPGGSHEKEGFYYEKIKTDKGEFPELMHGSIGKKFLDTMLKDIIKLANSGKNLIIDFVMSNDQHATLLAECIDCRVIQIGIKPPLDEVIRRERLRGDRKVGIAEAAYDSFYKDKKFDLLFDGKVLDCKEASEKVLALLSSNRFTPKAGMT